jgi:hypothetical protein
VCGKAVQPILTHGMLSSSYPSHTSLPITVSSVKGKSVMAGMTFSQLLPKI